ncbi:MAG: RsmD family RNA methyltransferase, partial [Bdellovibrionota bacterium]
VGGLGLEILSRGAASCLFVELERAHAKVLQQNIASLGCEAQTQVHVADVAKGTWAKSGPYDLVLLDPPYKDSELPELLARLVGSLKPGGIVLFEHDPGLKPLEVPGLQLQSHRVLGPAGISVYLRV